MLLLLTGLALGIVGLPAPAVATGVLSVSVTPVDIANGNAVITDAKNGTGGAGFATGNRISYLVQYSCGTDSCDNTRVQLSPPPADPHGLLPAGQFILMYDSFAPGSSGGTISGTDTTGKQVTLGDLAAGTSGSFAVTYAYQPTVNREVPNGSFYPEGFAIEMSAEITSDTAAAPATAAASDITWHIGAPDGPSPYGPTAALAPNNGTFRPDEPVTLQVAVNPGNMVTNPGANVAGSADRSAVGSYRFVYHVPPEATIESVTRPGGADPDAVIDNVNHTVTWAKGDDAHPVYGARGGWGLAAFGGFNSGGAATRNGADPDTQAFWGPRNVQVRFDGSQFPGADATGCNFPTVDVQTALDVSVTYLDADSTTKTIDDQRMNAKVACVSPFGGLGVDKDVVGGAAGQFALGDGNLGDNGAPGDHDVYATNVAAQGEAPVERVWRVTAANLGNVPGVAVFDEPDLAHDHLKVDRIYPVPGAGVPAGFAATIEWTASDGSSGTATGVTQAAPLAAPAGTWFTSARATTDPIPPGRVLPADTTRIEAYLYLRYRVDDGAIPFIGEDRTNTANVTMTYPGYGDGAGEEPISDLTGAPMTAEPSEDTSRAVRYTQPAPVLAAEHHAPPEVAGGAPLNAIAPGTEVTWTVRGATDEVWPGTEITPQLMFIAPVGWDIVPDSGTVTSSPGGAAIAGATIEYATRTFEGVERDVAIATWPGPVTPSTTGREVYGYLAVVTKPRPTAPAGVQSVAVAVAGDGSGHWSDAVPTGYLTGPNQFRAFALALVDADDLDDDGNLDEELARTNSTYDVRVTALPALDVVKEICDPDPAQPDGCDWVVAGAADPVQIPDDVDITYRVTMVNSGNVALTNAEAVDVLPYVGDGRGSEFDQTLVGTSTVGADLTLDYSGSSTPGAGDWGAPQAGAKAVRFMATSLPIGASSSAVFTVAAGAAAAAGQTACNALTVDSDQTIAATTRLACAQLFSIVPPDPKLALTKDADLTTDGNGNGLADLDDVITYTFTVENTGNVAVQDISISDAMPGLSATTPASVATLAPGGKVELTATYQVAQSDVDGGGPIVNTATAVGETGAGDAVESPEDSTSTDVVAADPRLVIEKTSRFADSADGDGLAELGEDLEYTFTVRNPGNVTIAAVVVDDPKVTAIGPAGPVVIPPGQQREFTATYVVTQADVDAGGVFNVATARGTDPAGDAVESAPDDNWVPGADPTVRLTVDKSAQITSDKGFQGVAELGEVITYTFVVTNHGPGTAHDVSVDDDLAGLSAVSPASVVTLAPGERAEFTATYRVGFVDVLRGKVVNRATSWFTPPTPRGGPEPGPEESDPSNEVEVPTVPDPTDPTPTDPTPTDPTPTDPTPTDPTPTDPTPTDPDPDPGQVKTQPRLTTKASSTATLPVNADGSTDAVELFDRVTLKRFKKDGGAVGRASLYGPFTRPGAAICGSDHRVGTVRFTPRNGTVRTPKVRVSEPGWYTWQVVVPGDRRNKRVSHKCGLKRESTLVHRPGYGPLVIDTGKYDEQLLRVTTPRWMSIPGIGVTAPVTTVGVHGKRMAVPGNIHTVGWLNRSARIGEKVGTTVIAGHVSDNHDRPGAFWKLRKAKIGQVVTIRDEQGDEHKYRITGRSTHPRSGSLPMRIFRTTGGHRLVLVTCTAKVTYPNGAFHYARNLVVTAKPVA